MSVSSRERVRGALRSVDFMMHNLEHDIALMSEHFKMMWNYIGSYRVRKSVLMSFVDMLKRDVEILKNDLEDLEEAVNDLEKRVDEFEEEQPRPLIKP